MSCRQCSAWRTSPQAPLLSPARAMGRGKAWRRAAILEAQQYQADEKGPAEYLADHPEMGLSYQAVKKAFRKAREAPEGLRKRKLTAEHCIVLCSVV